jgi:hypothetical protein
LLVFSSLTATLCFVISVTLAAMAKNFGVSVEFCDGWVWVSFHPPTHVLAFHNREISRFIAAGRLHAKIDKVFAGLFQWRQFFTVTIFLNVDRRCCRNNKARHEEWPLQGTIINDYLAIRTPLTCVPRRFLVQSVIKEGDALLNRIQKLARVVNVWEAWV